MNGLRLPILTTMLAAAITCLAADPPRAAVELTGIVNTPRGKRALLEVVQRPGTPPMQRILAERERIDGLEVVKIDPRSGKVTIRQFSAVTGAALPAVIDPRPGDVTIRQGEEDRILMLPRQLNEAEADSNITPPTLDLRAARMESVLDVYQEFAGRTVLRSPLLASFRLTVKTGPVPVDQAVKVLDKSLAESGVIMAPHGEKFVIAVPAHDAAKLEALPAAPETKVGSGDVIPPGVIKFAEADIVPVLNIYQDLAGRTLLRPTPLPGLRISLKSQTELTRAEAIHMLDVLLALGGLPTRPDGDEFVFVVPSRELPYLPAIMAQRKTPPVPDGPAAKPADLLPAGQLRFNEADPVQVLNVYSALTGRTAVRHDATLAVKITVRPQTDLTRREAIYALDALAALNQLKFLPVGDSEVTVVPLAEADRGLRSKTPEKF